MTSLSFINLEKLFSIMPWHVYWLDLNNTYQGCNDCQARAFGLNAREEVVGKRNRDLPRLSPMMAEIWDKNNVTVMSTGIPSIIEEPSILENGTMAIVLSHKLPIRNAEGLIIGLLGISLDITERKKHEDALREKIEEADLSMEHIISHMPGHVYWKNKEGVYLGCNDKQAQTLGLKYGREIIGKRDADLPWGKHEAEIYRENDLRILNTNSSIEVEETVVINGKNTTFLSQKTPLRNKQGAVVGTMGISVDITKQKEIEKELIKSKEAAELANKAKTEFLENMRHDIRTPLSGIVGIAELLEKEKDQKNINKYTRQLVDSSKELLRFLNEILESINVASGEIPLLKKKFCLRKTLENVVNLHQPKAYEKKLELRLSFDELIP